SKFLIGTTEEKKQIATLFDQAFHQHGVIRLINANITSAIIDKTKEFFALDEKLKLKYYGNGSYYGTPGYKPPGLEAVGNYKGDKKTAPTDSNEIYFTFFKAQSKEIDPSIDQLPDVFRQAVPEYILKGRQLISDVHQIADLALELNENILDKNYTSDHATFTLRLAKYYPPKHDEPLSLGEHQDYLGFTLIHNDDVPGLEVNVNGRWFGVESKPKTIIVVGGEFIQRWTNDYWISVLHRVGAVHQLRYSALLFSGPDMNSVIDTLPCEKCTLEPSKYPPITVYEHMEKRNAAAARN
ncbi:unnamed protein product, partial [Didymodactylos carnosus]